MDSDEKFSSNKNTNGQFLNDEIPENKMRLTILKLREIPKFRQEY